MYEAQDSPGNFKLSDLIVLAKVTGQQVVCSRVPLQCKIFYSYQQNKNLRYAEFNTSISNTLPPWESELY